MPATDIPALILRARDQADVLEMRLRAVLSKVDDTTEYGRTIILLRSLCIELEAERKRRLGPKDERWK